MHAMEATIGDDWRMALAADGLEIMPLGETTRMESQRKACQRYELEGTPSSRRVEKVWSGDRGCEPLVKEACG